MSIPDLSIIIPSYNEEEALPEVLARIHDAFVAAGTAEPSIEILVISDGSSDSTFEVARSVLGEASQRGRVIEFAGNAGSHAAIRYGLHLAAGRNVAVISADGQDPPELLPAMGALLGDGVDIVWGRRINRDGDSRWTRTMASVYYRLFRSLTGLDFPDSGLDFLVMTRQVCEAVNAFPERNLPLFLTIFNLGFGQAFMDYERAPEPPVHPDGRRASASKSPETCWYRSRPPLCASCRSSVPSSDSLASRSEPSPSCAPSSVKRPTRVGRR